MRHVRSIAYAVVALAATSCSGKLNRWLGVEVGQDGIARPAGALPAAAAGGPGSNGPADASAGVQASRFDAASELESGSESYRDASAGFDAGYACDFEALIATRCGDARCHGSGLLANGLDLTSRALGARVRGRNGTGLCSDARLIDPEDPARSVLYLRVAGDSCGDRMPLGEALSEAEVSCLLSGVRELADQLAFAPALDAGLLTDAAAFDADAPPIDAEPGASASDASLRDASPEPAADGAAGPLDPGSTVRPPRVVQASCDFGGLIRMRCGDSACHAPPALSTGLDLMSADLVDRLAGRAGVVSCKDKLLIDTDNPELSVLYLKVSSNECGTRMPVGSLLSSYEQDCMLSWIRSL